MQKVISKDAIITADILTSFLVSSLTTVSEDIQSIPSDVRITNLSLFCNELFETGLFDADVVCMALFYARNIVKKTGISDIKLLPKLFHITLTLASKYHDDFSVYDKDYRLVLPQFDFTGKKFMDVQFFALEKLGYDMDICPRNTAALRGIFGSISTKKNWVSEVMLVLNGDEPGMTLCDLVVIIEMCDWWLDLHPGHSAHPIFEFFNVCVRKIYTIMKIPWDVFYYVIEFACKSVQNVYLIMSDSDWNKDRCVNMVF